MRQIISTAVVAVVVGAVAGATMGAVAQPPAQEPPQAIVPTVTSINAHKVDGRHAVSASASRKKRSGKLVATNKQGYLPNNIIKPAWKLIGGKPAAFADGQIGWGEVVGVPAGFADGVDDGVGGTYSGTELDVVVAPRADSGVVTSSCKQGDVAVSGQWTIDHAGIRPFRTQRSDGRTWSFRVVNNSDTVGQFTASALCLDLS